MGRVNSPYVVWRGGVRDYRAVADVPLPASKRAINRAGDLVRVWWTDLDRPAESLAPDGEVVHALALVNAFRTGFQGPLDRTAIGVRMMVDAEGHEVVVTQRLKRLPTLLGKLVRHPGMQL